MSPLSQQPIWDEIAPSWNLRRTKTPQEVLDFTNAIPKSTKQQTILDLGCGSGRNFLKLPNTKLYATDFSKEMIQLAEKNAEDQDINVEIIQATSNSLPFKDNFFDTIICYDVIHCINSKKAREKTLHEIYRTLKPKGRALLSIWTRKSSRIKNKEKETTIPWTISNKKVKRYTYIYDKGELEKLVKKVGFKIEKKIEEKNITLWLTKL